MIHRIAALQLQYVQHFTEFVWKRRRSQSDALHWHEAGVQDRSNAGHVGATGSDIMVTFGDEEVTSKLGRRVTP